MSYDSKIVLKNVVIPADTGQFTACSFDYTAIPGLGRALVNPFMITADIKIMLVASTDLGDHGGKLWVGSCAWELSQGLSFRVLNSGVVVSTSVSPVFDVTGTTGRVRVIPARAGGTWYTRMELTIFQGP